ncbi:MAG: hypothetical protein K2X39_07055, partial [Silvanigrellaceae bacterium]|nr:hypothetical protein [Silvanigrellaceae bacterium]
MITSKLVSKLVGSCLVINFLLSMNAFAGPLDKKFPYSEPPKGDVCVNNDQFATPETMLGSWAMLKAVDSDIQNKQLPTLFASKNDVVYAVGTAAIGDALGIPNCSGGCNQINGFCFALKFNNKDQGPKYIILQSVNIAANANSFDIYMAGGGAGAFPNFCAKFWGNNSANWSANIENYQSCDDYFNYDNISSKYAVTYQGVT